MIIMQQEQQNARAPSKMATGRWWRWLADLKARHQGMHATFPLSHVLNPCRQSLPHLHHIIVADVSMVPAVMFSTAPQACGDVMQSFREITLLHISQGQKA